MAKRSSWHVSKPHFCTFESPEQMLELANKYFEWSENNPLEEHKLFPFQGTLTNGSLKKVRVFTIEAMCNHMGITTNAWRNYGKYEDYKDTFHIINQTIRDQKFAGAAAELFNPMIIARDLGLKDHTDMSSEDGTMTPSSGMDLSRLSTEALAEIAALSDEEDEATR